MGKVNYTKELKNDTNLINIKINYYKRNFNNYNGIILVNLIYKTLSYYILDKLRSTCKFHQL